MSVEKEIIGWAKNVSDIFVDCSSRTSRERILLLFKIVEELSNFSIIVIDSLCYQLSLPESDIDLELLIDQKDPDGVYHRFLQKITEFFPEVKIQNFSGDFYDLMEISSDLSFLQDHSEATEELFNQEQGHNLISIRDFYLAVKIGGMLIGSYPKKVMNKIETLKKNCSLLRNYTSDCLADSITREQNYFLNFKKDFYIKRLRNNLELFGITEEQLASISEKIDGIKSVS